MIRTMFEEYRDVAVDVDVNEVDIEKVLDLFYDRMHMNDKRKKKKQRT